MIRKLVTAIVAVLAVLLAALLFNTWRHGSRQLDVSAVRPPAVDAQAAARRLAGAIRLRTVSYDGRPDASAAELLALHDYLRQQFPAAHAALDREVVGGYSLLYRWAGSDASAKPLMLMAHQDVVPVVPGTEGDWQAPPFAGEIRDGYVWGRGAWDDKGNLLAVMEAVEALAAQGFKPRRTIWLAFGHDEETGGERGAKRIAELLASRGVRLEFVLDEGLLVTHGILKGLAQPLALIGIAEKGILNLRLSARAPDGHSSMPPKSSAIGRLGAALGRLERDPMPAAIDGVAARMFDVVAPEMPFVNRVLLSNLWLTAPLVRRRLEQAPSTNAMLRTTAAFTVFQAGSEINMLPAQAEAFVNFRLLPGDTAAAVVAHAGRAVADPSIRIERAPGAAVAEASRIASTDSAGYRLVERTLRELLPGTLVAPGLMIGATDARHMEPIADQVLRFSPMHATSEDLPRFHGTDERTSVAGHAGMIAFYHRLLSAAAGP